MQNLVGAVVDARRPAKMAPLDARSHAATVRRLHRLVRSGAALQFADMTIHVDDEPAGGTPKAHPPVAVRLTIRPDDAIPVIRRESRIQKPLRLSMSRLRPLRPLRHVSWPSIHLRHIVLRCSACKHLLSVRYGWQIQNNELPFVSRTEIIARWCGSGRRALDLIPDRQNSDRLGES